MPPHYWTIIIGIVLLGMPFVQAATIIGTVYDGFTFKEIPNARVLIETKPIQQTIAIDGKYSFELEPGTYAIHAIYRENEITLLTTDQLVQIPQEGIYNYDLILLPSLEMSIEEKIPQDQEIIPDIIGTLKEPGIILLAISLLFIGWELAILITRKNKAEPKKESNRIQEINSTLPIIPPVEKKKLARKKKSTKQIKLSGEPLA